MLIKILSFAVFIIPSFFSDIPCVLCFLQRNMFLLIFASTFSCHKKLLITLFSSICLMFSLLHISILLRIASAPKFCKFNTNIWGKIFAACDNSSVYIVSGIILINLFILWFINKE